MAKSTKVEVSSTGLPTGNLTWTVDFPESAPTQLIAMYNNVLYKMVLQAGRRAGWRFSKLVQLYLDGADPGDIEDARRDFIEWAGLEDD